MGTINDVTEKEAETREERLLLGFIKSEGERIGHGNIKLEVNIRHGKIDYMRSTDVSRTFKVERN